MKNKGFTLIELLAVIVILAIIALIATPMVLGVIDTAREGSAKSAALGYVDAVEKTIMIDQIAEETSYPAGTYTVTNGNLVSGTTTINVDLKGDAPDNNSTVTILSSGEVTNATLTFSNIKSDYTMTYVNGNITTSTGD